MKIIKLPQNTKWNQEENDFPISPKEIWIGLVGMGTAWTRSAILHVLNQWEIIDINSWKKEKESVWIVVGPWHASLIVSEIYRILQDHNMEWNIIMVTDDNISDMPQNIQDTLQKLSKKLPPIEIVPIPLIEEDVVDLGSIKPKIKHNKYVSKQVPQTSKAKTQIKNYKHRKK